MGHADELFKKAEMAIKKQNHEYAVELIVQGLMIEPDSPEWRSRLHKVETLVIQESGGNPAGGMGVKLKVLPHDGKAKKLRMQKKHDEEVIEIEKSLKHQPQNTGVLMLLAKALERCELYESSISVYEEVVDIDGTAIEALRALGKLVGSKRDDPEAAIDFWERLKNLKPDDKEAGKFIRDLSAAAMVRRAEERSKQTGDDSFRSMLKDEDEAAELEQKQAMIRTDEDRIRVIKSKMQEVKADPKNPKNSRTWRDIGTLFQGLKQWDKARQAFGNAMKVNPTDLFAKEKLELLDEMQVEEELNALREKVKADPSLQAELDGKEKDFLQFQVKMCRRRVEAHPTEYGLKLLLGRALKAVGKYDEAIGLFQQAQQDPKNKVGSKKEIGDCFAFKDLPDMAKSQYADALSEISDKNSDLFKEIKYSMGRACEDNEDFDEALQNYQQLMALDIGFKDISQRVADLRKKKISKAEDAPTA